MQDELEKFFAHPNLENYLRVREWVRRRRWVPRIASIEQVELAFREGAFQRTRRYAERLLPRWTLAPRLHRLAGLAAWELGQFEDANLDRFLYECCLQGILATGDGTAARPFLITYPTDAEEVVEHLLYSTSDGAAVEPPGRDADREPLTSRNENPLLSLLRADRPLADRIGPDLRRMRRRGPCGTCDVFAHPSGKAWWFAWELPVRAEPHRTARRNPLAIR